MSALHEAWMRHLETVRWFGGKGAGAVVVGLEPVATHTPPDAAPTVRSEVATLAFPDGHTEYYHLLVALYPESAHTAGTSPASTGGVRRHSNGGNQVQGGNIANRRLQGRHGRDQGRHYDAGGAGEPGHDSGGQADNERRGAFGHQGGQEFRQQFNPLELDGQIHQDTDAADENQGSPGNAGD